MAEAKIYDAELNPSKDEIASRYSPIVNQQGSYRAVDPDGKVGIEILVGEDSEGNLAQLGLSYREAGHALDDELTPLTHSELGERSVAYLTADPVAVREIIALILTGGHGADFSFGEPIFDVYGTGTNADATVTNVDIQEHNSYTAIGEAEINGEEKKFQLRLQKRVVAQQQSGEGELALVKEGNVTLIRLELWR
ncbi:hypothetical protein SAMN04488535_1225 [Corynebacterium mycetoides]|uniref:Uncharacterized protein n=1 Tax=Corynebacterium mycetoides TaxID=38302 RepID=A0A1G9NZG7_9CORY|nr:hypothetical protein [Corynebacterium mycetoides]SDL91375.1 hypothetical protein SAMN04488535_1225 [Corynebacterium mycetoides]